MNWSGKAVFGIILLFIGANLFLQTLGIQIGGLIGLAISIFLIIYGYRKMKAPEGSNIFGMAVLIFGLLLAIGHVHIFVGIFIAALIIYFGYRLLSKDQKEDPSGESRFETFNTTEIKKNQDAFDDEWNQFLEKNNLKL